MTARKPKGWPHEEAPAAMMMGIVAEAIAVMGIDTDVALAPLFRGPKLTERQQAEIAAIVLRRVPEAGPAADKAACRAFGDLTDDYADGSWVQDEVVFSAAVAIEDRAFLGRARSREDVHERVDLLLDDVRRMSLPWREKLHDRLHEDIRALAAGKLPTRAALALRPAARRRAAGSDRPEARP